MSNKRLIQARANKKDEFYTQMSDIEKELFHYKEHFKNKIIYLNCDDSNSDFFKYFSLNFEFFELKKLIATHYDREKPTYKLELNEYKGKLIKTRLRGNGDFKNKENIQLLKESDIIVTNPPFSLFREYINQLIEYNKKFIIIGDINAVTYNNVFSLIQSGKIWTGRSFNTTMTFRLPEYYEEYTFKDENGIKYAKIGRIAWYTNLERKVYKESLLKMLIGNKYDPKIHKKAENCDCIVINKTMDIPYDYDGLMAVPITFLSKYRSDEFELLGIDKQFTSDKNRTIIDGKRKYARLIIKRRK